MTVYRKPESIRFTSANPVEKHFHDYDETWIITQGSCKAFMVDHTGAETEFSLEAGDIWMIEAGVEHGCIPNAEGVELFPFPGTLPAGSHAPGHYYLEREGYLPTLQVIKTPTDRYSAKA